MVPAGSGSVAFGRVFHAETRPAGFPLLAAGVLAGAVGITAVLFAQGALGMQRYVYREVAGAALGLGLALFLAGATWSLPLHRPGRIGTLLGLGLCISAVAAFVHLYPYSWNVAGRDHSHWVVVAYSLGLAYLVAASTSGLLRAYVQARERSAPTFRLEDDVTDEEVVRDILETTTRSKLTWGGVRTDDRAITLSTAPADASHLQGNIHRLGIRTTMSDVRIDDDVGALMALRGVRDTASESYDLSNAQMLSRLRREQEAARALTWRGRLSGWWGRLVARIRAVWMRDAAGARDVETSGSFERLN